MRAIARVPAPDFGALGEAWAEDAAKKFDELAGSELDRAKEADRDGGGRPRSTRQWRHCCWTPTRCERSARHG